MDANPGAHVDRRTFLGQALASLLLLAAPRAHASGDSTFHRIYGDPALRERFFPFLQNIFHLYPEDRFHRLITELTAEHRTTEAVYRALLAELPGIKPLLGDLTYALPALRVQKAEMARQASELIGDAPVDGYVEIGTPGRYVASLQARVKMRGPVHLVHDAEPGFGPVDILERGGLRRVGGWLPLGDYDPLDSSVIGDASVDVVTNFIGFHHAPLQRLDGFIAGIHRVLRPGGCLLLREHDVVDATMDDIVALAHDVFNAGVMAPWEVNAREYRRFRSVQDWTALLSERGFRLEGEPRVQAGDPTDNNLLKFVKV